MVRELQPAERFVAATGVFAAAVTGLALLWNLTPWTLARPVWVVLFVLALGAALAVAGVPRMTLAPPRPAAVALAALALALGVAAFAIARDAARDTVDAEPFTQLWARGDAGVVVASIRNAASREHSYRLALRRDGRVLRLSPWVAVGRGDTHTVSLPSDGRTVEVVLYRGDAPEVPHRFLTLRSEVR